MFEILHVSDLHLKINDENIREIQLESLRQNIAIVTQDVQLFRASIRENLTFFDRSIPDEKIIATLEDLELGDWFRALPNGLDSELETGSRSLSAGEAQLLAFTRVFLRNPGLVILDEASSRLDPATEQRIERAVTRLLEMRIESYLIASSLVCSISQRLARRICRHCAPGQRESASAVDPRKAGCRGPDDSGRGNRSGATSE